MKNLKYRLFILISILVTIALFGAACSQATGSTTSGQTEEQQASSTVENEQSAVEQTQEDEQPVVEQTQEEESSPLMDEEQPAKEPEQEAPAVVLELKVYVSVPYWTEGEVYIGTGDNPAYAKLDKVNDTTYTGMVKMEEKSAYYYSLGTTGTKEVYQERSFTDTPLIRDAVTDWQNSGKTISKPGFQKGVTFGGMLWREDQFGYIDESLQTLKEYGVDHIILIPDWFVFPDVHGTEIKPYYRTDGEFPNPTNWITPTLSDDEVRGIISKAEQNGIQVVLKPHIDPIDFGMTPGSSRGSLMPDDWDAWFESYTNFIVHYADLAEETGVEMLVIGTELDNAAMPTNAGAPSDATERWRDIIATVRDHFSGPLTYSVSCFGDCSGPSRIKFWDALDYIGLEPYFGVTDKNDPSVAEMKSGFDSKFDEFFKPLSEQYDKPILITEANCYSFDGVNRDPIGSNIQQISSQAQSVNDLPLDLQEQADYYEALFQSIETRDWIQGIYWWGWYLDSTVASADAWSLQDKFDPFVRKYAGQVMKKWYLKIGE